MSIKIENLTGPSAEQWQSVIMGCRNPLNSWDKSDSGLCECGGRVDFTIGKNDMELMKRLAKAGSDHRKFARMLPVWMDITAPLYWISEHDTYKVGTTRNSCSFMHKGCSKPFEITDFSVRDERVYDILSPLKKKVYPLVYNYETDDYKIYTCQNGRQYKVFRNGRVVSLKHEYTDTMNRHRVFEEKECSPSLTPNGYYELNLGGRSREKWMLHRLVATVWIENPDNLYTVNHIDGNKGNNCVENLEWCSLQENIGKSFETGLMDNLGSLHSRYIRWKNGHRIVDPFLRAQIIHDYKDGIIGKKLAEKYEITPTQVNNIIFGVGTENEDLFMSCYFWEHTIEHLNDLRDWYLDTKDDDVFQEIRCSLPQGYNQKYTWFANYEVLWNIYQARKNHRLDEWREFCRIMVREVPYFAEIYGIENDEKGS